MQEESKTHIRNKRMQIETASAVLMLLSGIVMSFAGFFACPMGEISDSVLWYSAQTLIYAGSVFGVKVFFERKFDSLRDLVGNVAGLAGLPNKI